MSKIEIIADKCKGCGLCITVCNKKSIELSKSFNKAGYHPAVFVDAKTCNACGLCFQVCPDICIEVYKSEVKK